MIAAIAMPQGCPAEGVEGPAVRVFVPVREQGRFRPAVAVTGTLVLPLDEAAALAAAITGALGDFQRAREMAE